MRFLATIFLCLLLSYQVSLAQNAIRSLHPKPKASFERSGQSFTLDKSTKIVLPNNADAILLRSVGYLQSLIHQKIGDTLTVISEGSYQPGINAILLDYNNSGSNLLSTYSSRIPLGEEIPANKEGYILDINQTSVALIGTTSDGTFNGISTLAQLFNVNNKTISVTQAHIWDKPDYKNRWVFSQHNLLVTSNRDVLRSIEDTMALHKLNGLQQNDFKYNILNKMWDQYFWNVDSLKRISAERNIAIIPGVANIGYSQGMLYNDPNLAEGFEAKSTYVIEGDTGRLIQPNAVAFPNGGFESVGGNGQFTGWSWYDGPGQSTFVDGSVVHTGKNSARCTSFVTGNAGGNCRFNRLVNCEPNKYYIFTAWIKTQDFSGTVQLLALGKHTGKPDINLTNTQYSIPATTNGWHKLQVAFNTMDCTQMNLYAGVWGGESGTIWWDDIQIQEAGLMNVLRRPGTPLHLKNTTTGVEYIEGKDFTPIVDSIMVKGDGSYSYHGAPTFRRIPSGSIKNGDSLSISYFHPVTVYGDENGIGSTMVCISEDTAYKILTRQMTEVDNLYHPEHFLLGHDEIRAMNTDSSCLKRHLTPAKLLADNANWCYDKLKSLEPKSNIYIWSDMFDSLHNAHDNYYLVNGDLTGDWYLLKKDLTIIDWYLGKRHETLPKFAALGFKQMTSPYYDENGTNSIREWRIATEGIPGIEGSMYTTWANDYKFLTPFADYAWSAGPFMIHSPLDTAASETIKTSGSYKLEAWVYADPYDKSDKITSVTATLEGNSTETVTLTDEGSGHYSALIHTVPSKGYMIIAKNSQGLIRVTPKYIVPDVVASVKDNIISTSAIAIFPNPVRDQGSITFALSGYGNWQATIMNELGKEVTSLRGISNGLSKPSIDVSNLRSGVYFLQVAIDGSRISSRFTIIRN